VDPEPEGQVVADGPVDVEGIGVGVLALSRLAAPITNTMTLPAGTAGRIYVLGDVPAAWVPAVRSGGAPRWRSGSALIAR
jgi:hypothetical protein